MSDSVTDNKTVTQDIRTESVWGNLFDGSPVASFRESPQSVGQVQEIVTQSFAQNRALYFEGGGTSLFFGGNPTRSGGILETGSLQRVLDYPVADMTISVEAGITLANLQAVLAENNQYLPIDPPEAEHATLGGIMATGWTGPRRHSAMRPRDQIIGIGFIDGTGRQVRGGGKVVKNVAGYDFPKLLTGSVGALGVITDLTFKVRPIPESTALAWVNLPDLGSVDELLERLNTSATRPSAIELLNSSAASKFPELAEKAYSIVLFFDDSAKTVQWQCERILTEIPASATCQILRDSEAVQVQNKLTQAYAGKARKLIARVSTRPSAVAKLMHLVEQDNSWDIHAHAGQGIVSLMLREDVALEDDAAHESLKKSLKGITSQVSPLGGSVTLPLCPKELKGQLNVWGSPRPDWSVMAGLKRALDPAGILNAGRIPGLA